MNRILLLTFLFSIAIGHAQSVDHYYGINTPEFVDGVSARTYFVLDAAAPLDQSPSGSNVEWNFSGLSYSGISYYSNEVPTASDTSDYPGTTRVIMSSVDGVSATRVYVSDVANNISITGVDGLGLTVNYATNNAHVGILPLTYGYSLTDNVAGTYSYTTYSGTFTGTITTSVDGFGTLTTNDFGDGVSVRNVVRLKTVQTLSLNYSIIPNAGTATQTTYEYYCPDLAPNFPWFKTTTANIAVPLLSIDQTTTTIEQGLSALLSTENFTTTQQFSLAPNPASDVLNVMAHGASFDSITITDINGRTLYAAPFTDAVSVGSLPKGLYLLKATSPKGAVVRRFIKN